MSNVKTSGMRTSESVLCLLQVRQAYAAAAGEDLGQPAAAAAGDGKRKPVDGAECPICYEELKVCEASSIRRVLHQSCPYSTCAVHVFLVPAKLQCFS
jgi:hypothetical protein